MKRKFNHIATALLMLLTLGFGLSSCEVEELRLDIGNGNMSYRESTDYLCSYVWVDEWYGSNGYLYHQELTFYWNGTGRDYLRVEDWSGRYTESSYTFKWDWFDNYCTSIRLNYGGGDYSYLDNIRWGNRYFECFFDNEAVSFEGY